MRFEIHIGDKYTFAGIESSLDDDHQGKKKEQKENKRKQFSKKLTATVSTILVLAAGGYGLLYGDWEPLEKLWVFLDL